MTRSDDAAQDARSRRWRLLPIIIGGGSVAVANAVSLGGSGGLILLGVGLAGPLALLWVVLRLDLVRKRRRLPAGLSWKADAIVHGSELEAFSREMRRIAPTTEVVGWFEVAPDGVTWRPRPRFAKRGAPTISSSWSDIDEFTTARGSWQRARWLVRVDVFSFRLRDGRSVAIFVTNPGPVHTALSELGRVPATLPSPWDG